MSSVSLCHPEPSLRPTQDLDRAVDAARSAGLECSRSGMVVELHGVVNSLRDMSPAWHVRAWHRIEQRQLNGVAGSVLHQGDMLTLPGDVAPRVGAAAWGRIKHDVRYKLARYLRAVHGTVPWTLLPAPRRADDRQSAAGHAACRWHRVREIGCMAN